MQRTRDNKRILLVGIGHLGSRVLDGLLRHPGRHSYVIAGRDQEHMRRYANLVRQAAGEYGDTVDVEPAAIDLTDVEGTARVLDQLRPDVVFSCVTRQSYWHITQLRPELYEPLAAAYTGPFLPMHLSLIYKLMQAVRLSSQEPIVVNAAYPDATHPTLATAGLSPDVGIGNVALTVGGMRTAIAQQFGVAVSAVEIRAAFHHWVSFMASRAGDARSAPFYLSIRVEGEPLPIDRAAVFGPLTTIQKRLSGADYQHLTAATAVTVLRAFLDDADTRTHAPGPNGLPGGWPVRIRDGRVELDLPPGLEFTEARRINEQGGRFDGIDAIDPDGSVRFTPSCMEAMTDALGYQCSRMLLTECDEWADELQARFNAYLVGEHARV